MKKSIITILTLIIFSLFTSQAFACSNETTVTATIDYVYYDDNDHMYYAVTTEDALKGRWILDIESSQTKDTITLEKLNKAYSGKQTVIIYIGSLDDSDDIEIVSNSIID